MGLALFIIILIFIFTLSLIWRLFLHDKEIKQVLPKESNVPEISGKEPFRILTYLNKTALGFYRVICEKFLYLDKKHAEKKLSSEKPQEEEEGMVILETGTADDEVKENEIEKEILDISLGERGNAEPESIHSEGSHYSPNDLREILKKVLNEDDLGEENPSESIKVKEHEEYLKTEPEEETESELNTVRRRFKKRIKKVTKEIVSCEILDLEGVKRCEKAFAIIICLRNGEKVMDSVVKVPEHDCADALLNILKRLWIDNSPKDFLMHEAFQNESSQALSESMFYILNEAVLLYLFCYFFYEKPDTFTEYEKMESGQKEIIEIYHRVNIHIASIYEQIPLAFSNEKTKVLADEFQKIQWFSFPQDFSPFLKVFLTPEQKKELLEYNNCIWIQSFLAEAKRRKPDIEAEIEEQEVIWEEHARTRIHTPLSLNLAEIKSDSARKRLEETEKIIRAMSAKNIKNKFMEGRCPAPKKVENLQRTIETLIWS